jgi:hypothetical protein
MTFEFWWILTFNFNSKKEIGFSIDQTNLLDVDFGELNILKNKTEYNNVYKTLLLQGFGGLLYLRRP